MAESIVVLHVDDDPDFAALTRDLLERERDHLEVHTEQSVEEGLERLEALDVDCIVSDYDMPGHDGLDFLERVRRSHPDLPFILYTGKGSEEVASDAFSMGATDYLKKAARSDQTALLANRVENAVERARAEAKRRRNLAAIETAREGIAIIAQTGEFLFVNERFADLYGHETDTLVGETWDLIHTDEEVERMREEVVPALRESGEWHGETFGRRADGSTFVEDHTLSLTDTGEIVCSVSESAEPREENRFETIFEAMGDGVYALDADGRLRQANEPVAEILGVDRSEVPGLSVLEFFDDGDVAAFQTAIEDITGDGEQRAATVEATVRREDEADVPIEVTLTTLPATDGEFAGTIGVARDVRDRRARQRELEEYETMIETMGDGVFALDAEGAVTEVNESLVELLGEPYTDVVGDPADSYFEESDVEAFQTAIEDLIADDDRRVATVEAALRHGDGDPISVEANLTLVPAVDGEYQGAVAVVRDVTERRQREQELERYETLLELMPDTVVVTDMDGTIVDIHGYAGWSGYEYDELVGEHMSKTMTDADIERAEATVADLVRSDDRSKATYEHHSLTKDDEPVPFENHITLLPPEDDGTIPGTMSVLRDVSARVARERELERQNERLEEFAGIVSHDLRNPLNVAAGHLDLARADCESDHLDSVAQAHDRMEALIEDVLALARESEPVGEMESVDVRSLVEAAWRNVDTDAASLALEASGTIQADESRAKQLVENLLRNAVEHGGEDVTVTVGELADRKGFYLADDGPGIPAAEREQIFESGHTTADEGTGFGLSIVREIAQAHGWEVRAAEAAGGGARFDICCDSPT